MFSFLKPLIFGLDPEVAHDLAIKSLQLNIIPENVFKVENEEMLETNFLKKARQNGNKTQNGKMMFIYQAHQAFTIWHKIMPEINEKTISLLNE